jgi:Brp/Blh family beta-carotene 15,15'-monooxygenase
MILPGLLTLLAVLLALLEPETVIRGQHLAFLAVVGTVGMAHGALDHRIQASLAPGRYHGLRFYGRYLMAMGAMALLWWRWPGIGLAVFLLSSAYHFGQEEWPHRRDVPSWWMRLQRFCWGTVLLAVPLAMHAEALQDVLPGAWTAMSTTGLRSTAMTCVLGGAWTLCSLAAVRGAREDLRPLLRLAAFSLLLAFLPPLWGFSIYFGCWHAWPALRRVARALRLRGGRDWALALLPNYLPALAGTLAWIWASAQWWPSLTVTGLLVLLSALTVPHAWVFERLYARRN